MLLLSPFFSILKTELVYQTSFKNKQDALSKIFEYIEIFYNRQRMHSTLGYLTPASYEQELLRNCA